MKPAALEYTDLVDFGVKASADKGVAFVDVQRAFVRAVRAVYSEGAAQSAAATSGFWELMSRNGGYLPASKALKLYGGGTPVTAEALRKAAKAGHVIGVRDGLGEWMFPVWQFGERGGMLPGLREILSILREGHPAFNDLTAITFFLNPSPYLKGRTPVEALRDGDHAAVERQARAAHE
jgi:hypothetical protein